MNVFYNKEYNRINYEYLENAYEHLKYVYNSLHSKYSNNLKNLESKLNYTSQQLSIYMDCYVKLNKQLDFYKTCINQLNYIKKENELLKKKLSKLQSSNNISNDISINDISNNIINDNTKSSLNSQNNNFPNSQINNNKYNSFDTLINIQQNNQKQINEPILKKPKISSQCLDIKYP